MPEYSRPNLSIPSTLWGEVKVVAFRRGVRPVEVVIELLREKFDDDYRGEKGLPSRASVQRIKDKVESMISSPPPAAMPHVVQSKSIGGVAVGSIVAQPSDYEAVPEHACAVCRERKLQTEMTYHAKTMKWVCNDCVENQKNQQ